MKSLLIILTLFLSSCNAKIIPGAYQVTRQLPSGDYLQSEQALINFNVNDTVYLKWIRTEDMRVVRLFKL